MTTSVHLPRATEERLDALVSRTGRAKSYYLRKFIEQGLEDAEDYMVAQAVLERVRKGEELVYSAADLRRDLGLDD